MIDTTNIFEQFTEEDVSGPEIETQNVYGWIAPDKRQNKDELSAFGLKPYRPPSANDEVPQLQPDTITSRYFFKVYDRTKEIQLFDRARYSQFTVTYGNSSGDGSPPDSNNPDQAIYRQYANSLLPKGERSFGFARDHFYAVNLNRRTFKKRIRPGHWQLTLAFEGEGAQNGVKLVDKSIENETLANKQEIQIGPGDLDTGTLATDPLSGKVYGYVYPNKGIILMNPDALAEHADLLNQGSSLVKNITPEVRNPQAIVSDSESYSAERQVRDDGKVVYNRVGGFSGDETAAEDEFRDWPYFRNHRNIFEAIAWNPARSVNDPDGSFRLQVQQDIIDLTYTVILEQDEYNYSFNPTFSDDNGNITFEDSPGTYPTTIGLYNNNYELMATAKLSPPKEKTDESGIAVDVSLTF